MYCLYVKEGHCAAVGEEQTMNHITGVVCTAIEHTGFVSWHHSEMSQ